MTIEKTKTMLTAQTIALIIIAGFALFGFASGLIRGIGSIVGIILGAIVATKNFAAVGGFLLPFLGGNKLVAGVTAYLLLFLAMSALIGFLFLSLDRIFQLVAIIPGLKALNRIGGLLLGIVEGVLIVGVIFNAYTQLPLPRTTESQAKDSALIRFSMRTAKIVLPGYSKALERAKTIIQ